MKRKNSLQLIPIMCLQKYPYIHTIESIRFSLKKHCLNLAKAMKTPNLDEIFQRLSKLIANK